MYFKNYNRAFARIYDRGNYTETSPLLEYPKESSENCIKRIVKIFGVYEEVEALDKNVKSLAERNKVFKKALAIDLIKGAKIKLNLRKLMNKLSLCDKILMF